MPSSNQLVQFFSQPGFSLVLVIWVLIWKGIALWKASRKRQVLWYGILLILNTLGILEILYIFWLSRWDLINNEKVLAFLRGNIGDRLKTK